MSSAAPGWRLAALRNLQSLSFLSNRHGDISTAPPVIASSCMVGNPEVTRSRQRGTRRHASAMIVIPSHSEPRPARRERARNLGLF